MTKEELEKEAEEWLCNNLHSASEEDFTKAMVDIAEPREKQIQIDAEQIRALQKDKGELTDRVKELETSVSNLRKDNKELREVLPKLDKENDELKYKLTKAKELLTEFNQVLKEHNLYHNDLYKKTKQFLSEVEK